MVLTFVSHISAFLSIFINTRVATSSCAYIKLSTYFNGRHMVFIVYVIEPGITRHFYKSISLMDITAILMTPFHMDEVVIYGQVCYSRWQISMCQSDLCDCSLSSPCLVVWYTAFNLLPPTENQKIQLSICSMVILV